MTTRNIFRYTIALLSLIIIFMGFFGGNEILRLKEENYRLKKQVSYLELTKEYEPVLEKSEAIRSGQNNDTRFSRRINEAVYINCRRLENSGKIFQETVNSDLVKSNHYILRAIGGWQLLNASRKIVLADLDGSLNL